MRSMPGFCCGMGLTIGPISTEVLEQMYLIQLMLNSPNPQDWRPLQTSLLCE